VARKSKVAEGHMPEFIALTCLKCGGKLQIRDDKSEFTCPYCGTLHIYNPDQGMFFMSQIEKSLKNVEKGVDKTASELAIRRLKDDLSEMPQQGDIWEIKNEIWQYHEGGETINEALQALLKKQNPNTRTNLVGKIFGSEYSESEIGSKLFSTLSESEIDFLINFCINELNKSIRQGFSGDGYRLFINRFQAILNVYKIQSELDRYKEIVNR
jgi:predicted RNA-binding Zn-ribbon protein involved in translation (DUF1610 family)